MVHAILYDLPGDNSPPQVCVLILNRGAAAIASPVVLGFTSDVSQIPSDLLQLYPRAPVKELFEVLGVLSGCRQRCRMSVNEGPSYKHVRPPPRTSPDESPEGEQIQIGTLVPGCSDSNDIKISISSLYLDLAMVVRKKVRSSQIHVPDDSGQRIGRA